jgi:Cu(I)/Ag(I) efflux system membrane fusion protein
MKDDALKRRKRVKILTGLLIAVLAFAAGYLMRGDSGSQDMTRTVASQEHAGHDHSDHAAAGDSSGETVWTCSMHPQIQLPEPGQCPICFMDLIPLEKGGEEDEAVSLRQISLSPTARKLAQVTVAPVERRSVSVQSRMPGKVEYDETRMGVITAWIGGRIDELYVDATGDVVKRGQAMASIYSPELLTAQVELIEADKALRNQDESSFKLVRQTAEQTKKAAQEKLRLLGLSRKQIDKVLERGTPSDHVTLYAPMGGVVIEKNLVEGGYVDTGTPIFKIADLSKVWVVLSAYESDLPWIEEGGEVSFTVEGLPGKVFSGKVIFINQVLDESTRTVDVRLLVDNPGYRLKPGMLVKAVQEKNGDKEGDGEELLAIPASAPLITGKRAVVYVSVPDQEGVYEGREIVLGPRAGDYFIVREGLSEGEEVVVKGNFKIDSALQIMAKPSMMSASSDPAGAQAHQHQGNQVPEAARSDDLPVFDVPMGMVFRLSRAAAVFNIITRHVQEGDLEAARQGFADFYEKMRAVDPVSLEGDAALHWRELSILLKNDAVLGREAESMKRMERVHAEAWGHFKSLSRTFPIDPSARAERFEVPEMFRRQLGRAYEDYARIMEALAADEPEKARRAAEEMKSSFAMVNMLFLEGEAHSKWLDLRPLVNEALQALIEAEGLTEMRVAFEPLSLGMIEAVNSYGMVSEKYVYVLSCPMAFENKGAVWLQSDENIRNPYFGSAMYRCGEVLYRTDKQ